jgi:hypothetical protein
MNTSQYREIPRAKIQQGIELCKKNIFAFLETTKCLISSNNLNHAAINLEFAIEEFGKILFLKDEYAKQVDPIQVPNIVFTSHKNKSKRAWRIDDVDALDSDYKMISEGGFERSDDGREGFSRFFEQVIYITHFIRLECAFVDFDVTEREWFLGHPQIVGERIQKLVEHLSEKTEKIQLSCPSQ